MAETKQAHHTLTNEQVENWKQLIKELRASKYKQVTGRLCRLAQDGSRGYCCLGVAGMLHKVPTQVYGLTDYKYVMFEHGENSMEGVHPNDWWELHFGNYSYLTQWHLCQSSLFHLNDNEMMPFPQIADTIESRLTLASVSLD